MLCSLLVFRNKESKFKYKKFDNNKQLFVFRMRLEAHKYLDIEPDNPVTSHVSIFFMSMGIGKYITFIINATINQASVYILHATPFSAIALVGLLSCYCTLSGNPILLYMVYISSSNVACLHQLIINTD